MSVIMASCGRNLVSFEDRKIQGYELCKEFLGGSWKKISFEEFRFNILSGGLSNELFICSLPDNYPINETEHRKALLRIYGQLYGELVNDVHALVSDVVVFSLLSERKVGPKLFAIFPEGRLEELIPARNLSSEEIRSAPNSVKIARKLKQYHEMVIPLSKEPNRWMWDFILRLLQDVDEMVVESDKDSVAQVICNKYDLRKEFNDLKNYITSNPSPVVFCHNDLQEGNILAVPRCTDHDGKQEYDFQFIDYEYSAYNYRGFDIANHFCEWIVDYTLKEPPHFGVNVQNYPTKEEQLTFIRAYLGKDKNQHSEIITLEEEEILDEAKRFAIVSHFLWAVWSIVQSKQSTIDFGYAEYALARLELYDQQKHIIMG